MAGLTPLLSTRSSAQTAPFDHRWSGTVFDVFTFDGGEFWTVEDGGRIRHRPSATGTVHFQVVPNEVKDSLRRIHFVPDDTPSNGPTGWAVGETGWIIKTVDGGTTWNILGSQMPAVLTQPGKPDTESLWDVHFLDQNRGWLSGLHGIWSTVDGGASWTRCTVRMQDNHLIFEAPDKEDAALLEKIEFYSLDVVERPGPPVELVGMASSEPGLVFRTTNGIDWKVVLDIRCLCGQTTGCPTAPGCPHGVCYDCSSLPPIDGCLTQPGNRTCETKVCEYSENAEYFEAWEVDVSGHPTQKFAVMVGGIGHQCGMVFTSVDDGLNWKKEPHECHLGGTGGAPNCSTDPLYNDVAPGHPDYLTHTFKQSEFGALYGCAIFDGDNSAILTGYGGVHAYRAPSVPIWRDVSEYNNRVHQVPNAVTYPLLGAAANNGDLTTGKALIVGMGGFIREKDAGGTGWGDAAGTLHGSPWRIRDIHFLTDALGFQVGQFSRIAKTTDSGAFWNHGLNAPDPTRPTLKALAFASDGQRGVTVGMMPSSGDRPAIWRTTTAGGSAWEQTSPTTGFSMGQGGVAGGLLDVAFAGFTSTGKADYWAAGEKGFMLHSRDDGETWTQFIPIPPGASTASQPLNFAIDGVAFKDIATGIFVGDGPDSGGVLRGLAFQWKRNGSPVWSDITPPAADGVKKISDVVITGDTAYAVGEDKVGGVRSGVVLKAMASGGIFGPFAVVAGPSTGFPLCLTNDSANDLEDFPVLTEAEIHPITGDLWIGGQCGRVWKRTDLGVWTEFKSQTDTHILGISFGAGSSGVVGYFGGHRTDFPQGCVVRYQ